jgi:predicted site-specific integrase-resolvase
MAAAANAEVVVPEPGTRSNPALDLATVARRIGQSKKSVRRLLRRGEFPNVQWSGGKLVVPEQDVLAYLRRQRAKPVTLVT